MIVKVERYKDQKYWLFDNIAKLSVSRPRNRSWELDQPGPTAYEVNLFDIPKVCSCQPPSDKNACSDCVTYYVIICRMKDGEEMAIAFDTVAYIMNDDGKTIDKVVANYETQEQLTG